MSSASSLPSGTSEVASNVGQIIGEAYFPGTSLEVVSVAKIEGADDLQPSCLQFSPTFPDYLVVGTYALENPTTQSRKGNLLLYWLNNDGKLVQLDNFVHSAGIFDIKFNNPKYHGKEKFAVASSNGNISMFKFEITVNPGPDGMTGRIIQLDTFPVFSESAIITSLAWHSSENGPIAVSQANGDVAILTFRDEYTVLHNSAVVGSHDGNEAWTVAFGMHVHQPCDNMEEDDDDSTSTSQKEAKLFKPVFCAMYSGGDDSRLRFCSFFRNEDGLTVSRQHAGNRHGGSKGLGGHNAGVTAILPVPFKTMLGEEILITGSYDNHVRVYAMYDRRASATDNKPKVLTELDVGDGVWRLAFLGDFTKGNLLGFTVFFSGEYQPICFRVLAFCTQGGIRVLEVNGCLRGEWNIAIVGELKFNTPNELVYAGDVQPEKPDTPDDVLPEFDGRTTFVIVSANFYERQLCVWLYRTNTNPVQSWKTKRVNDRKAMHGQDGSAMAGRYRYAVE